MHGLLELLLPVFIGAAGFVINRWAPLRKARYSLYAAIFLVAFIFDLNNISFASDTLNSLFYLVVFVAISEIVWLCAAKKNKLLLGCALCVFAPLFIYLYAAALVILPFPCHEGKRAVVERYNCGSHSYILKKQPSLDVFQPGHVYILSRSTGSAQLQKRIDKYLTPKGYYDAYIAPRHECAADGIKIDLYVDDSYVLWSLGEVCKLK